MKEITENNLDWEYKSDHDILVACVGYNFGKNPEERLDEIRKTRGGYGWTVMDRMKLKAEDVVMDIGSGCGFVGRTIAPHVKALHCVDLSPDFLGYCSRELSGFENVSCHLIKYADFSPVAEAGINKVYSTAVWIHFNYYDLNHYLAALAETMVAGGEIYFDYADPEGIGDGDGRIFEEHYSTYRTNRATISNLVQYNGESAVRTALEKNGFKMKVRWQTGAECYSVLAKLEAKSV